MASNPKVLIIDDNPANLDFLIELLKHYDVSAVTSAAEAREAIEAERPDLILLDISMPEEDGITFCRELKNNRSTQDIPVIFLTAATAPGTIAEALEAGGVDYITKPYIAELVSLRIQTQLKLSAMRAAARKAQMLDRLTGTKTGEVFMLEAKKWLEFSAKSGTPLSILTIRIATLDFINHTYGIAAGNAVIRAAGAYLNALAKKNNYLVGRQGGALFMLAIYGSDAQKAKEVCQTIEREIGKIKVDGHPDVFIQVDTGVADTFDGKKSVDRLIRESFTNKCI